MQAFNPQLTPEQRQAIAASGGLPIQIEDPDTHKIYVLLEQPQGLRSTTSTSVKPCRKALQRLKEVNA